MACKCFNKLAVEDLIGIPRRFCGLKPKPLAPDNPVKVLFVDIGAQCRYSLQTWNPRVNLTPTSNTLNRQPGALTKLLASLSRDSQAMATIDLMTCPKNTGLGFAGGGGWGGGGGGVSQN